MAEPTVFIVDDDAAARESVAQLVRSHGLLAESFATPGDFLAAFDPQRPGCAVLDLKLADTSGLHLQKKLAHLAGTLPVIIVSGVATVPTVVAAMKAGAVTVLEKTCSSEELLKHIRAALERNAEMSEEAAQKEQIRARLARLTPDERRVLDLLLKGEGNKQIAVLLDIGLRTVELRRSRMMEKMEVHSLAELVRLVTWVDDCPSPLPPD